MFGPAGFLILLQLTDHVYDRLIHALNLAIGLSMVRQGSQLLHPIQLTEVCYNMACEGLPLITDEIGRCTKKTKIPISQSLWQYLQSDPSPHMQQCIWRSDPVKPAHYG